MFRINPPEEIPINRACLWILLSTLLVSGSAFMGWLYYQHAKEKRLQDEQYRIVAIVQSCPQQEGLKTGYLAELLELSLDQPINLYLFDLRAAEKKLLACPLIKSAFIQKILPGTLYIRYEMRTPVAYVGDFSNTAVDVEGYLFPFRPFFTPKKLPIVYLGLADADGKWGSCLAAQERLELAFDLLKFFKESNASDLQIKQVDVAEAYADSYGRRQVVIMLEESADKLSNDVVKAFLLRLNTEHYKQNIANFFSLQTALNERKKAKLPVTKAVCSADKYVIVDLRIPHLAFIKEES
ncbi:putative cell division protein FtsQ [Candidatus Protochlamydia naegleriophila]|uniref:Putative cell division protein FtsQ n=1 Tax=Candidatus Protochlamydia naegleriophila TaxID=389348 RepID=A0A0U5JAZ2_9BACT|nr:FtsQ-type POTRA domain-containing protein [Candidatus Protochlamydia naegleriophila]CUI16253.1 putative cell division protein FtsQ [Candidatus Protochlamydia naegleriophila]